MLKVSLFTLIVLLFALPAAAFGPPAPFPSGPTAAFAVDTAAREDENISLVGRWAWGPAIEVQVEDDIAYLCHGGSLETVDFAVPDQPVLLDRLEVTGLVQYVAPGDGIAVLATQGNGMMVVDISDPSSLSVLSTIPTERELWDIEIAGSTLLVMVKYNDLRLYDLSDPAQPVLAASVPDCRGFDFAVHGDLVYVSAGVNVLNVLDISDPYAPAVVGSLQETTNSYYLCLERSGDLLIGIEYRYPQFYGWAIFDISEPLAPAKIWSGSTNSVLLDVAAIGERVFLSSQERIHGYDISAPAAPVRTLDAPALDEAYGLFAEGDRLYATSPYLGLQRLIVAADGARDDLVEEGFYGEGLYGAVSDLEIRDGLAYVAGHTAGFAILDVADAGNPALLSRLYGLVPGKPRENINHVALIGDYIYSNYTSSPNQETVIIDVSDPTAPFEAGRLPATYWDWTFVDHRACVLESVQPPTLRCLDMTDPLHPVRLTEKALPGQAHLARDEHCLYVACEDEVIAFDLAALPAFSELGRAAISAQGETFEHPILIAADGYLHLADWMYQGGGLITMDVTDPAAMTPLGLTPLVEAAYDLDLAGGFLYASVQNGGVEILDMADPAAPRPCARFDTGSAAFNLSLADGLMYVADGWDGVYALRNDLATVGIAETVPSTLLFGANYPNPFNPATTLTFTLPGAGFADLSIYDAAGRRMRGLIAGALDAGPHEVMWHGRDDAGRDVASGVYFARLRHGGEQVLTRLALIR